MDIKEALNKNDYEKLAEDIPRILSRQHSTEEVISLIDEITSSVDKDMQKVSVLFDTFKRKEQKKILDNVSNIIFLAMQNDNIDVTVELLKKRHLKYKDSYRIVKAMEDLNKRKGGEAFTTEDFELIYSVTKSTHLDHLISKSLPWTE